MLYSSKNHYKIVTSSALDLKLVLLLSFDCSRVLKVYTSVGIVNACSNQVSTKVDCVVIQILFQ